MRVLGLTGGVASGKSLVAQLFADLGAGRLDADRAAHEVLAAPEVIAALAQQFGAEVLNSNGQVDRARVAALVFAPPPAGPAARQFLEQLTHPLIARVVARQAEALARKGVAGAVLEAPLLFEAGWDHRCDRVAMVEAPRAARLGRAATRGWSETQFAAREAAQWPVDEKRRRSDFVIDNSGSVEATRRQVDDLWQRFLAEPPNLEKRLTFVEPCGEQP